jgi:hypothetical protein
MPAQPRWHRARGRRQRCTSVSMHTVEVRLHHWEAEGSWTEARGCPWRNPSFGRRQIRQREEAIEEILRMGRCAVARFTRCAPSRRLTPERLVGIEGDGGGNLDAGARAGEEEEGRCGPTGWVRSNRARLVRSSPIRLGTWQVGPGEILVITNWEKT